MGIKNAEEKKSKTAAGDDAALQAEVRDFAAQLGLASGGTGAGFDDSDFRPEKAKKRIGQVDSDDKPAPGSKKRKAADQTEQGKPGKAKKKGGSGAQAPGSEEQATDTGVVAKQQKLNNTGFKQKRGDQGNDKGKRSQDNDAAAEPDSKPKGRDWKESAGAPPGAIVGVSKKSLLGKGESGLWWEAAAALVAKFAPAEDQEGAGEEPPSEELVESCRHRAEQLMLNEVAVFDKELRYHSPADGRWLAQVKTSGTTNDKIAAATMLIQSSAIANLRSIDTLLGWVSKRGGGKAVVGSALAALGELFRLHLLPPRKLRSLEQQPLRSLPPGADGDRLLLYWAAEDEIKRRYSMFLGALEEAATDNLEFVKERAVKAAADLLAAKPEGEARLLALLVNKLGDPDRKQASKASYLLGQLLVEHPAMKMVVVREAEKFIFRPKQADRARYYGVVFLNQLVLSHKPSQGGAELATKLIDLYFTLFRMLLEGGFGKAAETKVLRAEKVVKDRKRNRPPGARPAGGGRGGRGGRSGRGGRGGGQGFSRAPPPPKAAKAEEMDARMVSALITGVRRAFPYVQPEAVEPLIEQHAAYLFRIMHTAPFTVALQALLLLFQLMSARSAISDRFYRALYAVLLRPDGPASSSRAPLFLGMLFKAMKVDVSVKRAAAFAKRLLQVACAAPANFACGSLLLLSEVLQAQPALRTAIMQSEDVEGTEEHFTDVAWQDDDEDGEGADDQADRIANGAPQAAAGHEDEDGDEESAGRKVQVAGAAAGQADGAVAGVDAGRAANHSPASTSAPAASTSGRGSASNGKNGWPKPGYYDMAKREPQYCGAERACWWELVCLAKHAHPSVAAMARTLLAGSSVLYSGDPLRDLTLIAFLDKFAQRKPKAAKQHGSSLMQPLVSDAPADKTAAEVGSDAFAALAEARVEQSDVFFHKFYNLQSVKAKRAAKAATKKSRKGDDDEEGSDGADAADGFSDDGSDGDVDAFLAQEEEGGADEGPADPDAGFDYDQLAAAMADDGEEGSEDGGEELGDDEDGEEDVEDIDELNILDLPSPSEDEDEGEQPKRKRSRKAAAAEVPDDDASISDIESSDEEGDWVMAEDEDGDDAEEEEEERPSKKGGKPGRGSGKQALGKGKRLKGDGMSAFAAAEDYEHLFNQAQQAEAPVEGAEDSPKQRRRQGRGGASGPSRRKQGGAKRGRP